MEGFYPNDVSYVSILTACTTLQALEQGKHIHSQISKTNATTNIFVANALVDMYATCESLSCACKVFNEMLKRNVVSWNTIIAIHVKHGLDLEVWQLFQKMIQEGVDPDEITFVSLVNACSSVASVHKGFLVHNTIVSSQYDHDLFVGNALIDMYAKCGKLKDASKVLDRMPEKDIVSWNTMLAGYAQHGVGQEAISLVGTMLHKGMELNHVSFVAILTACSHAGLVDEGWYYFIFMTVDQVVEHAVEHYGCMVDLLARCGQLYIAEKLLKMIPSGSSNTVLWRALLGACRVHGNMELAMEAAACILCLEPNDSAVVLLISNVYALSADECFETNDSYDE
jgi:pentatricopeptide repeat protein